MWYARHEDILNSGGSGGSGDTDPDYYAGYYLLIDRVDDSMEDYFEVVPDDYCWSYYFNTDELYPYRRDYYLETGDKIKVVYFDGESMTEFFEPFEDGWYTVDCESGFKTIYFDPYGDSDWENYYICIKDYVCNHEYNSYGVCIHCEYLKPGVKAGLSAYRVSLDGYIAVEYFMILSDAAMESPDAAMKFMVPNGDTSLAYSAFTFGYVVTNSEGNEELKVVVNAMYEFNVQAEIYSGYVD